MRTFALAAALALTLLTVQGFADNPGFVCRADALAYNTKMDTHFEGRIAAVIHGHGFSVSDSCTFVTLVKAGVRTTFYIGPQEFIARNELTLAIGDTAFITGAAAAMGHRNRGMVLARSIRTGTALFVLRDEDGKPLWLKSPVEMDPEISGGPAQECLLMDGMAIQDRLR